MSFKFAINFFVWGIAVLLFAGCEKKPTKQKTIDMLTTRTLGLAYLEENKLKEAEAEFLKLIEIAPEEALGYANLGLVYRRMGKYPEAEKQIKKALAIESKNPDIRLMLATLYELADRESEALKELENTVKHAPDHVKSLYAFAELCLESGDETGRRRAEENLKKLIEQAPANLVARLQLIETLLRNGKVDQARSHLEQIGKQMPEMNKEAARFYDTALALMWANKAEDAITPTRIFHNLLKVTALYQAGVLDLKGPGGALAGFPIVVFSQNNFTPIQEQKAVLGAIRFTDVTVSSGLDIIQKRQGANEPKEQATPLELETHFALGDYDGDTDQDLYVASGRPDKKASMHFLCKNNFGNFVETSSEAGINHTTKETAAAFADYDNDGKLDLYIVNPGPDILYRNRGNGKFANVTATANVADSAFGHQALFVDLDHEGDLDLYLANATVNRLYRNNSDGTFTELAEKMGLGGQYHLYRNKGDGTFEKDTRSEEFFQALRNVIGLDAAFFDFDNDGGK